MVQNAVHPSRTAQHILSVRFGGSIDTCTAHHNELLASSLGLSISVDICRWGLVMSHVTGFLVGLDSLDHGLNLLQFPHVVVKDDVKFAGLGASHIAT